MNKFHLTIYSSALLLLLVVKYSESCVLQDDNCNHTQKNVETQNSVDLNSAGSECVNPFKQNIYQHILKFAVRFLAPLLESRTETPNEEVNSNDKKATEKKILANNSPQHQNKKPVDYTNVQRSDVTDATHHKHKIVKPSNGNVCEFSINGSDDLYRMPLLLTPGSSPGFIYPDAGTNIIKLKEGEKIRLACPGKENFITIIPPVNSTPVADIEARCHRNSSFTFGTISFRMYNIVCEIPPVSTVRQTRNNCLPKVSGNTAKYVEIGFELKSKEFVKTIDVCWEDTTKTTYWTEFNMTTSIIAQQPSPRRASMQGAIFYGDLNVMKSYRYEEQQKTMEILTGSSHAKIYINDKNDLYIRQAKLANVQDFSYRAAKKSTYWIINSAPQWSGMNGGNWLSLESSIRKFVAENKHSLLIYTGTHGQMFFSLEASTDANTSPKRVPFNLYVDAANANKTALPVPKYFWKILYDPQTRNAIAFVVVNDPWARPDNDGVKNYCKDNPTKFDWLDWKPENAKLGLSYVCKVDELRKIIPTLPDRVAGANLM